MMQKKNPVLRGVEDHLAGIGKKHLVFPCELLLCASTLPLLPFQRSKWFSNQEELNLATLNEAIFPYLDSLNLSIEDKKILAQPFQMKLNPDLVRQLFKEGLSESKWKELETINRKILEYLGVSED